MNEIDYFIIDYDEPIDEDTFGEDLQYLDDAVDNVRKYVIQTEHGFHLVVVAYDSLSFERAIEIVENTGCDKNYLEQVKEKGKFFETINRLEALDLL